MKRFYYISILSLLFAFSFASMDSYALNQEIESIEKIKLEPKITISDNILIVDNPNNETIVEIFSIVGVNVFREKAKTGINEYILNLPKGYYIIRVGNTAKKIALR